MGIANIDSAARTCHAPSTVGLKQTIGVAASTCSMQDVLETDLIVLWGTNVANNQPVFTKYLYLARKRGARVVVVNPYLEPGLERYWVPSNAESALFGTKLCDLHVAVRPEGDVALANAVVQRLVERDAVDHDWIAAHTEGWDELVAHVAGLDRAALLEQAGIDEATLEQFVDLYAASRGAVFVWSMGITQHTHGVEGVRAIVNVGLARGNAGRDGAGLMPIRGHSGVQGGAEMGAYATAFPGGEPVDADHAARWAERWGFAVRPDVGLTAPEMVEAAERGDLDVLFVDGSNLLEVMPDPARVETALGRVPLRVHQDIVVDVADVRRGRRRDPAAGGDALRAGGRRHQHDDRAPDRVQSAGRRPTRRGPQRVADLRRARRRVRPDLADRFDWDDNVALRTEIADVVPLYAGIEDLAPGRRRRAVRRSAPLRRRRVPDPVWTGPVLRARRRADRARARRVVRVDPSRQAVQLDGPRARRTR